MHDALHGGPPTPERAQQLDVEMAKVQSALQRSAACQESKPPLAMPDLVKSPTHDACTWGGDKLEAFPYLRTGRCFKNKTGSVSMLCDQFVAHPGVSHGVAEAEDGLQDFAVKVVPRRCGILDLCRCAGTKIERRVVVARRLKPQILLGEIEVRQVSKPGSLYRENSGSGLQPGDSEVEGCFEPARFGPSSPASARGRQPRRALGGLHQSTQGSDQRVDLNMPLCLDEAREPELVGLLGQWAISCFPIGPQSAKKVNAPLHDDN